MKTLVLLASAGLLSAAPTQVSLVNPGFEAPFTTVNLNGGKITGQTANGWSDNSTFVNAAVQYSQDTDNPHGGASSQKIVVTSVGTGLVQLQQGLQVHSGVYTITAWMRGVPGSAARLRLNKVGSTSSIDPETDVVLTSAWQQVSAVGLIPADEAANLTIGVTSPGTVWVDDVTLSYDPGGTLPLTPNLGRISPSFFGMHVKYFAQSQLRNGGFELAHFTAGVHGKVTGDVGVNWLDASQGDALVQYAQDTSNPHSGVLSQKISVSAVKAGIVQLYQVVALQPGATYTMTAWLRGSAGASATLYVQKVFAPYDAYFQGTMSLTSDWKQYSITGQVNDDGVVNAAIRMSSPGTIWVDDVSVTDATGQPVSGGVPWPAVGFGTLRLWDFLTTWSALEPMKGVWNWDALDSFVEAAGQHGVGDILLTLGQTPTWASSNPDSPNTGLPPGATAPPTDIQDWRDYITAVGQRYKGRIRYFEIWNEPDLAVTYTGTVAQMVTLTQEAYKILKAIDPGNMVVSPPPASSTDYLDQLLAAGMGNYVDMLGYHEYPFANPPEAAARYQTTIRQVMAKYGLSKMPLWDTEGANGDDTTPLDVAPKYIARRFLTELAYGSVRFNWFIWDIASKYEVATTENDRRNLTAAGRAYGFLYGWLAGSTLTQAFIDTAGNWQIWVTRPDGNQALVVWNPTQTSPLTLPATFSAHSSHDLAGGVRTVSSTVTVTDSPVFLTATVDAPATISSVNVAGGASDIAQNTWIEIRGNNLVPGNTPATGTIWSAAPEFAANLLPTQLGNIPLQVTVNNKPAYLYFFCSAATNPGCASDQINVLTPLDSTEGPVQIVVYNGISSASFTVNLRPAAPSFPLVGKYIVATHTDYSLVGPASLSAPGYPFTPAKPGETILIYAFGFGLPKSTIVSGSASQTGSLPTLPVIQIGGAPATVTFAGVVGPGLFQLNVVVPGTVLSGDNRVTCSYNGGNSPLGDLIAIQ